MPQKKKQIKKNKILLPENEPIRPIKQIKEAKFPRLSKSKKIFFISLSVAVLGIAIFFAQKYARLYLDYMEFEDFQYYLSQRNEFYGEDNEIKDWSFGRYLQYLKEAKEGEKLAAEENEKLLDIYRQDTVGGKTPEETWKSYLDAINESDFEFASKHWVEKERKSILVELKELQERNHLDEFFQDFPNFELWRSGNGNTPTAFWNGVDRSRYYYDLSQTDVGYEITFELNPYSNVWKISSY